MTKKIFRSIMLVAGAVLILCLAIIMSFLYGYFGDVIQSQLNDELELAAAAVEDSGVEYLGRLESERYRITWVKADGVVLYDTQSDHETMENHADRREIIDALASGRGESARYSTTLLEKTVYCAKRLSDGTVLRISVRRSTAGLLVLGILEPVILVFALVFILSFALARRVSRRIVEPLNALNLDSPLDNDAYEELAPLLLRLSAQNQSISDKIAALNHQRDEFLKITGSMREGLVLLDEKGVVVSINPIALKLFGCAPTCVGGDFLTVERSPEISRAIERAMADGHGEARAERAGRVYQFDISGVESGGKVIGAVLLAFDVTEQEFAERNRREFTANVSHELKTPLQSIIGGAELIENQLVKPGDMPRIVGHIRREAARMVTLIDDIIRLSQLDEGAALPTEDVCALKLCEEVAASLKSAADLKRVSLRVSGSEVNVKGVRRMLNEIVYNLCDNAIKYTPEGGSVDVTVQKADNRARITVTDTGIGIPEAHQARVFERFYRVDKSHSKASGGTGLGLSIVKHAVSYHKGEIKLKSAPGEGTQITVTLPAGK